MSFESTVIDENHLLEEEENVEQQELEEDEPMSFMEALQRTPVVKQEPPISPTVTTTTTTTTTVTHNNNLSRLSIAIPLQQLFGRQRSGASIHSPRLSVSQNNTMNQTNVEVNEQVVVEENIVQPILSEEEASEILVNSLTNYLMQKRLKQYCKSSEFAKQRTRMELIRELLTTERTYVRLLKAFIDVYVTAVEENAKAFAPVSILKRTNPAKYKQLLFNNVEQILQINQTLLKALEKDSTEKISISKPFIIIAPFMKHYVEYINAYDVAHKTYKNLIRDSDKFENLMNTCVADPRVERNKFGSLLILPVQRIPRYRMLLQQILENTETDHIEYDDLKKALDKIIEVAGHINEQKRESSHLGATAKVGRIVQHVLEIDAFISPTRRLIGNPSSVSITDPSNTYQAFLFNDCLVLVESDYFSHFDKDPGIGSAKTDRVHLFYYGFCRLFTYTGESFILDALVHGKHCQLLFVTDAKGNEPNDIYLQLDSLITTKELIEKAEERCIRREHMQNMIDENDNLENAKDSTLGQLSTISTQLLEKQELIRKLQGEVDDLLSLKQALTEFVHHIELKQQEVDNRVIETASQVKQYDGMFINSLKDVSAFKYVLNDTPEFK
jgi:hypothetical protein